VMADFGTPMVPVAMEGHRFRGDVDGGKPADKTPDDHTLRGPPPTPRPLPRHHVPPPPRGAGGAAETGGLLSTRRGRVAGYIWRTVCATFPERRGHSRWRRHGMVPAGDGRCVGEATLRGLAKPHGETPTRRGGSSIPGDLAPQSSSWRPGRASGKEAADSARYHASRARVAEPRRLGRSPRRRSARFSRPPWWSCAAVFSRT